MPSLIASRTFSAIDQEAFARWSGDRNPVHMDKPAARRTQAGGQLVHGLHAVLWALEQLATGPASLSRLASLKVRFSRFIHLDQQVALHLREQGDDLVRATLSVDGQAAVHLVLKFGSAAPPGQLDPEAGLEETALDGAARAPRLEHMAGLSGWLTPPPQAREMAGVFPRLCLAIGEDRVRAMAQISTLVGMACPGLHSLLSGFLIEIAEGAGGRQGLGWRTQEVDARFRLVTLDVAGSGLQGEVSAFVRFEPIAPPRMADLKGLVAPQAFGGRTAMVVGGSRGLGAATALLLAAGGARVILTYATGKAEALALTADIQSSRGTGAATALRYDATGDPASQLGEVPGAITHAYYFATPRIFHQRGGAGAPDLFKAFADIYVEGFGAFARWLVLTYPGSLRHIFYPSSLAVTDRPEGMVEYALAKAEGERLCAALIQAEPGISISAPRLPRVLTDQTATIPPIPAAEATATMLPLLLAER